MKKRFCSVTTLTRKERKRIYHQMSWENGEIRYLMATNMPNVRMCLLYEGTTLITWVYLDLNKKTEPRVGAWTCEYFRRQGLVEIALSSLLRKCEKQLQKCKYPITVWHTATRKVIEKCGYKVYHSKSYRPH